MSSETCSQQNSIDYIFKIILIGDSNSGKTSLITRYVNNTFDSKHLCTIGVDFMMKKVVINNKTIKLQIWDTAGMEKYKQITSSYYRGAQGAIVVFDLSSNKSFFSVKKWIDDFFQISGSKPNSKVIILVGNKSDLKEERQVSKEEINSFVEINANIAYFDTSAKTGDGVNEMFKVIIEQLIEKYNYNNPYGKVCDNFSIGNGDNINTDGFNKLLNNKKSSFLKCC